MFGFSQPTVPQINAADVKAAMDAKKDIVLLDVRTPKEYESGHLIGSINIPVNLVISDIEAKIPDRKKTMYVYCLSGNRSARAVETMIQLGYTDVHSMTSGILSWRKENFPLEQ